MVGLVSDLLNPKIGAFYLAVVPQFIPGAPVLQYSLLLCAIDVLVALVWFSCLAWLAHAAVLWIRRPRFVLWSQRLVCVSLIAVGVSTTLAP